MDDYYDNAVNEVASEIKHLGGVDDFKALPLDQYMKILDEATSQSKLQKAGKPQVVTGITTDFRDCRIIGYDKNGKDVDAAKALEAFKNSHKCSGQIMYENALKHELVHVKQCKSGGASVSGIDEE